MYLFIQCRLVMYFITQDVLAIEHTALYLIIPSQFLVAEPRYTLYQFIIV